jgi:hypothetical protein
MTAVDIIEGNIDKHELLSPARSEAHRLHLALSEPDPEREAALRDEVQLGDLLKEIDDAATEKERFEEALAEEEVEWAKRPAGSRGPRPEPSSRLVKAQQRHARISRNTDAIRRAWDEARRRVQETSVREAELRAAHTDACIRAVGEGWTDWVERELEAAKLIYEHKKARAEAVLRYCDAARNQETVHRQTFGHAWETMTLRLKQVDALRASPADIALGSRCIAAVAEDAAVDLAEVFGE